VWIAATTVLAVLAIYALTVLMSPRESLSGTNSVALTAVVDTAVAGEQVCTGVRVPPRTSIVQVFVGLPEAERSTLRASLRTEDGGRVPLEPLGVAPGLDAKSLRLSPTNELREGDLCLVSRDSRIDLGGSGVGHNPGEPTLRIGERERADVDISVRFLRSNEMPSLLSLLPKAPSRAQVFRPGPIGAWLYWAIGLFALPGLAYAGLRLLATARERSTRRMALTVAILAFASASCWAVTTPLYQAPDESEHFSYAQYVAETGAVPERAAGTKAPYSTEQVYLLQGLRHTSSIHLGVTRPRWLDADQDAWERLDEEQQPARDNGGGYTVSAHSHSPLYYGALVPAYLVGSGGDLTWRVTLMRLLTAAFASVIAACAALTVRELLPGYPTLAVLGGLLVAFQPVVAFMSGAINNDSAVNAAAGIATYLVVRALRRGLTVRLGIGIGLALVALPLAKIVGYGVVPAMVLGLLIAAARLPRRAALAGAAAAVGTIAATSVVWTQLIVPALARDGGNLLVNTGAVQPSQTVLLHDPVLFIAYLIQTFIPPIHLRGNLNFGWPFYDIYIQGAFGRFGWAAIGFPPFVYRVILVVVIGLGILAVVAAVRNRAIVRARWAPALVLALAALGVVSFVAAAYATGSPRPVLAEQGRYGFPALVPIAALAAFACLGLGRRYASAAAGALAGAMIALGVGGWLQALSGWYV
jgi:hypothetical protein